MISPNAEKANDLHNQGIVEYKSGRVQEAIRLWQRALDLRPPLGLEVFIRKDLTLALFEHFKDMSEGTRLTPEQAERFHEGEKCLSRLSQLCSGEAPEGPVTDLSAENLSEAANMTKAFLVYPIRASKGWYVFPGDETARRVYDFGMMQANAGNKIEASTLLSKALEHLDISQPEHRTMAMLAHSRLAILHNDLRNLDQAGNHAKESLSLGLPKGDSLYTVMMVVLRRAGQTWTEQKEKKGLCLIATTVCGTESAAEVRLLRNFRDNVLLSSPGGRCLVRVYTLASPPVAKVLNRSLLLRNLVRNYVIKPLAELYDARERKRETEE